MTHPLISKMIEQAEAHREYNTYVESFSGCDSHEDLCELFQSIANMSDGEIYYGYSGRSMYGRQCWGITGEATQIIEAAVAHGLYHAKLDSMGRKDIVYWPNVDYVGASESEED